MIDFRDEALFERYFSIFLTALAERDEVAMSAFSAARARAELAIKEHRALFPLPAWSKGDGTT